MLAWSNHSPAGNMREKIRELTKDTAIYGISTIVGRFLGFLLVPFYTHFISPGAMGIYTNIYAYLAFLNIVLHLRHGRRLHEVQFAGRAGRKKEDFFHRLSRRRPDHPAPDRGCFSCCAIPSSA